MLNQTADRVFHALADGNRRAMIERLTAGPATVSELATLLGVTLAATVQHLRVLQDSELVLKVLAQRSQCLVASPALVARVAMRATLRLSSPA